VTAPREIVAASRWTRDILVAALMVFGLHAGDARAQSPTAPPRIGQRPADPAAARPGQTATATPLLIALMPFDGKDTPAPPKRPLQPVNTAGAVADTLSARPQARYYKVLGPDLWAGMARLRHHGRATDVRPIARLIKANVVIGGWIEATPGPDAPKPYRLTVTVYDDQGQVLGQLGYDVDKAVLDPRKFSSQGTAFFQMLDQALHLPATAGPAAQVAVAPGSPGSLGPTSSSPGRSPTTGPAQAAAPASGPASWQPVSQQPPLAMPEGQVVQLEDKEKAPLGPTGPTGPLIPQTKEAHEFYDRRPPWLPGFELRAGYLYNARAFTNVGSELRLPRTGSHGAVLHGELYPFSFGKSLSPALAGLGVRVTALLPVWRDIGQVAQEGGPVLGYYSATEQRIEAAIRWQYNYWGEILRPIIELEALFGDHNFTINPKQNIDYGHLPSSEYRYLGALIGGRIFFTHKVAARLGFTFAKLLSLGALSTPAFDGVGQPLFQSNGFRSYGPGDGTLWRIELGASYDLWKGITLAASFFYEQNKLSFAGQGNVLQTDQLTPVSAAQDEYLGVMITLGYAFRPFVR